MRETVTPTKENQSQVLESATLRRTALILVIAGLLWNLVEAGVFIVGRRSSR